MSDESTEAPLTETQASEGIEAIREQLLQGGGALAFVAKLNEGVNEISGLDARTFHLVRIAAGAAMNTPGVAWEFNLELAEELGITAEEVLGVLVAIAPIIGSARFLQAVTHIVSE